MAPGGRDAREAERRKQKKMTEDAEKCLKKLQNAVAVEDLSEAVRRAGSLKAYLPALAQALPDAQNRLKKMRAEADKGHLDDFMSRVEEAERRDAAAGQSRAMLRLEGYFNDLFADSDEDGNGTMDYEEFKQAMDIIAPAFEAKDLKAAFATADRDRSGTIDRKEFMQRAPQYQLLSEKMASNAVVDTGGGSGLGMHRGSLEPARLPRSMEEDMKTLTTLDDNERAQAKALFSKYDKDRSGGLDFDEFRKVMTVIAGEGVSDGSLLKAFEAVDTNSNGKIDYAEFLNGQQELRKWKQKKKPKKKR